MSEWWRRRSEASYTVLANHVIARIFRMVPQLAPAGKANRGQGPTVSGGRSTERLDLDSTQGLGVRSLLDPLYRCLLLWLEQSSLSWLRGRSLITIPFC